MTVTPSTTPTISNLPQALALSGTEIFPIVQGGTTKSAILKNLSTVLSSGLIGATGPAGPAGPTGPAGSGATAFTQLTDCPATYGLASPARRTPVINLAGSGLEFKYSTPLLIDIRDYGNISGSGTIDITAALVAAMNDAGVGIPSSQILFAPSGPASTWTLNGQDPGLIARFNTGIPWIFHLYKGFNLTAPLLVNGISILKLIGHGYGLSGGHFTKGGVPAPTIGDNNTVFAGNAMIAFQNDGCAIQDLNLASGQNCCLQVRCQFVRIEHCKMSTASTVYPPLWVDNCFGCTIEHCEFNPRNDGTVAAAWFNTDLPGNGACGIIDVKDVWMTNNGFLFRANSANGDVNNMTFDNIYCESMVNGGSLFTFDGTNGAINGIRIRDAYVADALGAAYLFNAKGLIGVGGAANIIYDGAVGALGGLFDPTSAPIKKFFLDQRRVFEEDLEPGYSTYHYFAGTRAVHNTENRVTGATDARLLCAPPSASWVPFTPIALLQDPSTWTPSGGAVVTAVTAPDGSQMAGKVTVGGSAQIYTNAALPAANGDMFIFGCWLFNQGLGPVDNLSANCSIASSGNPIRFDSIGSASGAGNGIPFNQEEEDRISDMGWRWVSRAAKLIDTGQIVGGVVQITVSMGAGGTYFAPCLTQIPAASVYDDVAIYQIARSMKGGWSSNARVGEVSCLDHQGIFAGYSRKVAKTFATLPSPAVAGMQAYITNCNTTVWGAVAAGGGANKVMVWYNGAQWTVIGA